MKHSYSTLAKQIQIGLQTAGHKLALTHSQQLLAAALGYYTHAAMKASKEEAAGGLAAAKIVVLDVPTTISRCASLQISHLSLQVLDVITRTLRADPSNPKVFSNWQQFLDEFAEPTIAAESVESDGTYEAMAETNAIFDDPGEIEFPGYNPAPTTSSALPTPLSVSACGGFLEIPFVGTITGESDEDRMYSGHILNIEGIARIEKVGRRCLLDTVQIDLGASVDDSHYDTTI